MGIHTYSCSNCQPIDSSILAVYIQLVDEEKSVSANESNRVTAENGRVEAENERERVFGLDHGTATDDHATAVSDHGIAGDDHLLAVADHGTAGDDHTIAAGDHVTAGEDHLASTSATSRANDAAAAAEHMVDIHQGPPGADGTGITEIEQTVTSHANGGQNTVQIRTSDGNSYNVYIKNGSASNGLFPTSSALNTACPSPAVGDFAYVGSGFPADIYVCQTAGTWVDSGEDYDGDNVDLTDYAMKAEVTQLEAKLYQFGGYLVPLLKKIAYEDNDAKSLIDNIDVLLNTDELLSITAVYTQPGIIYAGESLDDLKPDLVVTANYASGTSLEVSTYTLSGALTAGTSTITVTYQEKTTTFNVTVTDAVYVKDGSLMPGRVGLRNSIDTASGLSSSYVLNGVSYVFSSAYANGGAASTQKRCSYFLFDLLVTAGKQYKYIFELNTTLSASQTIQASLGYVDETYRVAGEANLYQTQNYSSHTTATSWFATTKDGDSVYFDDTAPTGYVGVRITLKYLSSGSEANWPTTLSVKRLIVQEVTE